MSADQVPALLLGAASGAAVAVVVARVRIGAAPARLLRTNLAGRAVPAVLGDAVAAGALAGLPALAVARAPGAARHGAAVAVVVAVMWAVGRWDDLRGDERDRGFRGHLRAAARGRLTGGLVKIAGGAGAGVVAGLLVADGAAVVAAALVVPLAANLFNLLDRAPGRAGKLWLLVMAPVVGLGDGVWVVAAAGTIGALAAVLPADLAGRGMLGDAGANLIGAVWGLGVAASSDLPGAVAVLAVLAAFNAASERWSFSRVIERTPGLRAFDRLGRK